MKKNVGLWLSGFFVLVYINLFAQGYPEEALLFSRTNSGGSARIQSMGGAQVALGGDYSSAFSNPAGLGFFNRSEATFSLGTNFYNSSSSYLGTTTGDSKANVNVPGFSLVLHSDKNNGKLVSGNFAISFTRINNFNQNVNYLGANNNSSMIDYFIGNADYYALGVNKLFYAGDPNNPPGPGYSTLLMLGYDNYLFGPKSEKTLNGDTTKYDSYLINRLPSTQREQIQTSGAQNQWNFAYGVNFDDQFYFGASIGIPTLNYTSKKTYTETFPNEQYLHGFQFNENLRITGTGVNAVLGAIIKPKDFIQFGLSVSTPTYYPTLSEDYTERMSTNWNGYNYVDLTNNSNTTLFNKSDSIYYQSFLYSLTTPWKIKAGATVFIQKHGFITAEIEKLNYSKASFGSNSNTPYDFSQDNSNIKVYFRNVFNVRVGGEYRYNNFRFRLGYSYMPDPYNNTRNNINNTMTSYTAGVGYRTQKYSLDLGLIQTLWKSSYLPYDRGTIGDTSWNNIVLIKNTNFSAMVTVGFTL